MLYENRVPADTGVTYILAQWHKASNLVAVARSDNTVLILNEEGDVVEGMTMRRKARPVSLCWHPLSRLIACGWSDGGISVLAESEKVMHEEKGGHASAVTLVRFSPSGSRLISGDDQGVVALWKLDERHRMLPFHQYKRQAGAIAFCEFRMTGEEAVAAARPGAPCPEFFLGTTAGTGYLADDMGHCTEVFKLSQPIVALRYYKDPVAQRDSIAVITENMVLTLFRMSAEGGVVQDQRVKLSMQAAADVPLQSGWIGPGLLATTGGEGMARVWNLAGHDNYNLSTSDPRCDLSALSPPPRVSAMAFNARTRTLALGTAEGRVVLWRFTGSGDGTASTDESWRPLPHSADIQGPVVSLDWAADDRRLLALTSAHLSLLVEAQLNRGMKGRVGVFQASRERLTLFRVPESGEPPSATIPLQSSVPVKGVDADGQNVLVWSGRKAEVFEIGDVAVSPVALFPCKALCAAVKDRKLFLSAGQGRIDVCTLEGSLKTSLSFSEPEGEPVTMDANGTVLVAASRQGVVKMWDFSSQREVKPHGRTLALSLAFPAEQLEIVSAKVAMDGRFASLLATVTDPATGHKRPDSRIHVYDVDSGNVLSHDFGPARYPVSHFWDGVEPKLFAVETQAFKPTADPADRRNLTECFTLYATTDNGIRMQDSFIVDEDGAVLVGLHIPNLYFTGRATGSSPAFAAVAGGGAGGQLSSRTLRDFVGMDFRDAKTREALLAFSYNLTMGNMDDAYASVRNINSAHVWENMAQMCVKTKRLDVVEVCLGQMKHTRGARALREGRAAGLSDDALTGIVAIHLNLIEDAEDLYHEGERFDLLNELYQASGKWEKALKLAETKDRIHLRTTHFLYARYLESVGDYTKAAKEYENAATHRAEVPRMLYSRRMLADLKAYVQSAEDAELNRWWAQYCESTANWDEAISFYTLANDVPSLVRVHCFRGDFERATQAAGSSNNPAACFYIAQQYEAQDNVREAISWYTKAGRVSNAARLAKEAGMDAELLALSLQAAPRDMITSALYFEQKGEFDRAVLLYQKAGAVPKALALCFRANLYESLRTLADQLGPDADPELLRRCGEFFMSNGQYDKAVSVLLVGRQYEQALELALDNNVLLTEDMAERMSPERPAGEASEAETLARTQVLKRLARALEAQGSFQLAAKKYTQALDKDNAMRNLLRAGDVDKIIFFAEKSRQREIFIMAANFLQTLEWHTDQKIMRALVGFYTKAKAYEQLASFYEACAALEIDEFRSYDKAAGALREAQKWLDKSREPDRDARVAGLQARILIVEKLVRARRSAKSNAAESVALCEEILDDPDSEAAVRLGDVFATLAEMCVDRRDYQGAHAVLERMVGAGIGVVPFVEAALVQEICGKVGADAKALLNAGGHGAPEAQPRSRGIDQSNDNDSVDEDIGEEIPDE